MKRRPPPDPQSAPAPTARQRRALSEEERALWEAVAKSTRPLKHRARKTKLAAVPPPVAAPRDPPAPRLPASKAAAPTVAAPRVAPAPPPLVALGRRERAQLSRGRKEIEARLDLHGMTQARAHRALFAFLSRASEDGMSFVLVITGKGRTTGPESERGILRRQVPEWLGQNDFRAFVIGFEEAHIGHGGNGALYVRVRRRTARHF
jgi:DNA-nicking Smr family endonuclease